jgi:hypothetical protein
MVVDHIVLKGGTFLVLHLQGAQAPELGDHAYLKAIGGVLVSFVMFCPLAGVAGLCGGLIGRQSRVNHAT